MKIRSILLLLAMMIIFNGQLAGQQVSVNVNTLNSTKPISPLIYGKNNSLSGSKSDPLTATEWKRLRDMGIHMFRENGGNNATKYNWRRKLSSHPDWYNNVYSNDWDFAAASLQANLPSSQGMWAFQLVGKAARTGSANFNDWAYNGSQWWDGCGQNLAGGGQPNTAGGSDALVEGNPELYLENWNADSTTGILNHWFGSEGLGLNPGKIQYWSMDNEPEIWDGTHDDLWPQLPSAEEFMQLYFDVAKKARAKYPDIKLVGPVPANEWQWYNWKGNKVSYNGNEYPWLEYFILRVAEEQQASGVRLLDVLDIHFYPGETSSTDIVQLHRIFFDTSYDYPGANGVKRTGSGDWDNSITKEYIFKRCDDWMNQYIGPDHGITFSVSETSIAKKDNPNLTASWYASTLGEFAKQGVEIFTPWDWSTGMSEVVHLFSRYGQEYYVPASSSDERYVSAYPTMNVSGDSMTIFLVNRHITENRTIDLNINDFGIKDGSYKLYTLSGLPSSETFVNHTSNALRQTNVQSLNNHIAITLAPLSVSAVVVLRNAAYFSRFGERVTAIEAESGTLNGVTFSSAAPGFSGNGYVTGFDTAGDNVKLSFSIPSTNLYRVVIRFLGESGESTHQINVNNLFTANINLGAGTDFTEADAGGFVLQQGNNTLSISRDTGNAGIDRIDIYKIDKKNYAIAPELVDTAATNETKALYEFLQLQFGHRLISGQTRNYYYQIGDITDHLPLLRAGDFQSYTQGYPYLWENGGHSFGYYDNGMVDTMINWYNNTGKKGIVALHWHWHSPTGGNAGTNTFWTDYTEFEVTKAVTPGTPEYDFIIRDIDSIAFQLKKFQQEGIPVLWRPLHEAGGGWFWWGAKGPEACLQLYDIMFDRLTNHHQLHNLIWTWSTPEPEWYPGNEMVDIIGHDSYPGDYNYENQKTVFDALYMLTRGEKMIAMTENGPIPDPDACLNEDAPWLYFMSWDPNVVEENSEAHIIDVYNHPDVLTLESTNFRTNNEWRSSLYPENWKPGFKDAQGRFLHDFSYAGYHMGDTIIPRITENVVDITQPPYLADNTGSTDVTETIQQALDAVGSAGGGVVYLPAGTYRISAAETSSYALRIAYDSTILRGAGIGLTFLLNSQTNMRYKDIIRVKGNDANWFEPVGEAIPVIFDIPALTHVVPLESVAGFNTGEEVILTSTPTPEFIAEHKMSGIWTPEAIKGVAFLRRIDSIDVQNNLLFIDAPTRYFLKTRDNARVYRVGVHITECGIEDLSIGNVQNPNTGWEEESYSMSGTGAYEVHYSQAIQFMQSENCWVKKVGTFKPSANTDDYHLLSNGIRLNQSRFITIDSCAFEKSQYEGGGGNGYMYTLESNDCLIQYSRANHGRHNYDFKYPYSNGNVILASRGENSKYASDFHMYLSMANLFDACVLNSDYLESAFRPYGGDAIHGYTSTQSVFYNTTGEAYHPDRNYLIDSRQFGWGYIIGTSGPAYEVEIDPAEGSASGYHFNTSPRDFVEGVNQGSDLVPASLYLDQLHRRSGNSASSRSFHVEIAIRDSESGALVPDCNVQLFNNSTLTDISGIARFDNVPEYLLVQASKEYYFPVDKQQFFIYSDTALTMYIVQKKYDLTVRLFRAGTGQPLSGTAIILDLSTEVTDDSGEVNFLVTGGYHQLEVNKTSYQPVSVSVLIDDRPTIIVINLVQTHANVKVRLKYGTSPVNLATVIVNEDTITSSALGIATFNQLPVSAEYTYTVNKASYAIKEGVFYLSGDTTIDVAMDKQTALPPDAENPLKVEFWPNPVENVLYLTLPGNHNEKLVRITDLRGIEVHQQKADKNTAEINVRKLPPGSYILQITSGELQSTQFFIKK